MMAHFPAAPGVDVEMVAEANPGWKVEVEADGSFTVSPTGSLFPSDFTSVYDAGA